MSKVPFQVVDAILRQCPRGLPARLLCDAVTEQGFDEHLVQSVIRNAMDSGDIELAPNMNIVWSNRGTQRRAGEIEHLIP